MVKIVILLLFMFSSRSYSLLQRSVRVNSYRKSYKLFATTDDNLKTGEDTTSGTLKNFITNIIDSDLKHHWNGGRVVTRFPPEPNGFLHLGHAKSINFNFNVAKAYNGVTHMRFDDTNPAKEDMVYVRSILDDVNWLVTGSIKPDSPPWFGEIRHASDYFDAIHDSAVYLIKQGLAYVDDLSADEVKQYRGTLTEPGQESPFRNRTVEENLKLFKDMRDGKFQDGQCVLRAKIDMSSPNLNLRDPTLYRIKKESHPITGNKWCIYPMYDFAHAISDAIEGITHSICTLEFADHRPLYDWCIDQVMPTDILPFAKNGWRPKQLEFSRLNMQYTVLSKRKLIQLVNEKYVAGWDDPRMPTIAGLRRRGYPSEALQLFCDRIGISKVENNIDIGVLETCVRDVLEDKAPRAFAISNPLKVTLTNWPEGKEEEFTAENHPKKPEMGERKIPFAKNLYIDREDFFDTGVDGSISPPKGYKRLLPGGQVRLKYTYVISCDEVIRDEAGEVKELICSYIPETRSGATPHNMKKVKGIIQWVSQKYGVKCSLALYDRLFNTPVPGKENEDGNFLTDLNPQSLLYCNDAVVEPSILNNSPDTTYQFERVGYFKLDSIETQERGSMVFNRVVTLKDNWANQLAPESTPAAVEKIPVASFNKESTNIEPIEDIRRVEFRVGKVLSVEKHPDADSLYVEKVDCGDTTGPRTIISGLVKYMSQDELLGRKVVVLCNLKPSKMRGIVSEGMLLAASTPLNDSSDEEKVELLSPPEDAKIGELISVSGYDQPMPDAQLKSKTALEVWKRVSSVLTTNSGREATYGSTENKLMTSAGPCTVSTLVNAAIR